MTKLTSEQRRTLEHRLTERRAELVRKVRTATDFAKTENITKVAGEVGDPGDESMAAQLVDLNLTEVQNELRELRAIEAAFSRLADDTYGRCTECGCEIPYARLDAYPTAERCTECQARHERVYGGRDVTPSL
ncbi:MAG: TraR/DksA family transcriptional regulator [Gammaproteobacteria bacterium]|nr:TraR/DksA family transcriptional regulator [Gammaproteobacteria bacterium]